MHVGEVLVWLQRHCWIGLGILIPYLTVRHRSIWGRDTASGFNYALGGTVQIVGLFVPVVFKSFTPLHAVLYGGVSLLLLLLGFSFRQQYGKPLHLQEFDAGGIGCGKPYWR